MSPTGTPEPATFVTRARARLARLLLRAGSIAKRTIQDRIDIEPPSVDPPFEDISRYEVVAYFPDTPAQSYQLRQWLPVLEQVAQEHPLAVVTRNWPVTEQLRQETSLPVIFTRRLDDVLRLYDQADVKTVVYVNNGMRNFQSLIYRRALHVHVNHGESDKISMVSNQAKAYDHVVVAGKAAIERHRRALVNFDLEHLVVCGRPQLDLQVAPDIAPLPGRRTVMYAPTWSGEDEANNYTSLDRYGVAIVRALLARDDVRVVYKPHPRIVAGSDAAVASAHAEVVRLITQARDTHGTPHELPMEADILGLFGAVDLLVTDISSVGLDFLYQRPEAPILLTDRRTDRERILSEAPVAGATDIVDADSVADIAQIIAANLESDPRHDARLQMRDHYFGFAHGESSARFLAFIAECVARRDVLVADTPRTESTYADQSEDSAATPA